MGRDLTAEPEAEAQRLDELLPQPFRDEARRLARQPDGRHLGTTAFAVRGPFPRRAAPAVETAVHEWNQGGSQAPG